MVSCAYGHGVVLELFPDAVLKQGSKVVNGRPLRLLDKKRGKILDFSRHSASRLREFLMTWWVPDRQVVMAWTFTIRRPATPAEWRQLWKQWRMKANRGGVAAVYRVELQKRKVPHVHLTSWQHRPDEPGGYAEQKCFAPGWLDTITPTDENNCRWYDYAEMKRAVVGRFIEDKSGWGVYQAMHSSKKGQSGWVGKQWGVIGRKFFKRREAVQLELTLSQYWRFRRAVSRWLKSKGSRRYGLPEHGKWLRCIPAEVTSRVVAWAQQKPGRV